MQVADMQLNSSDLVLMLDPSMPLQYMLQAGGASSLFRFGVPKLEVGSADAKGQYQYVVLVGNEKRGSLPRQLELLI